MANSKNSDVITVKDGKLIDGRVTLKIFPNLEQGELGRVNAIVLHQTGGRNAQGTLDEYKSSSIGAHFLIDKDGTIYQTVRITQKAFHVGKIRSKCLELNSCSPEDKAAIQTILGAKKISYSKKLKQLNDHESQKSYPNRYPSNSDSLGIEVASQLVKEAYEDPTEKQQTSVKWLTAELLSYFNLKTSDIYRHPEVSYKDSSEAQNISW